ncbi:MAG TPA: hypothetical protein VLM86_00255, partial [Candidatus Bathyarchaeia archaeon]|nr:hypothetical protein [Candidatus Bathyarchaeia archaeon]
RGYEACARGGQVNRKRRTATGRTQRAPARPAARPALSGRRPKKEPPTLPERKGWGMVGADPPSRPFSRER